MLISKRLRSALLNPIQLPSAGELDHATQKWLFYAFGVFAIGALALYATVFWVRGAHAEALEVLAAGLFVTAVVGFAARTGSTKWSGSTIQPSRRPGASVLLADPRYTTRSDAMPCSAPIGARS